MPRRRDRIPLIVLTPAWRIGHNGHSGGSAAIGAAIVNNHMQFRHRICTLTVGNRLLDLALVQIQKSDPRHLHAAMIDCAATNQLKKLSLAGAAHDCLIAVAQRRIETGRLPESGFRIPVRLHHVIEAALRMGQPSQHAVFRAGFQGDGVGEMPLTNAGDVFVYCIYGAAQCPVQHFE